jgi:hypothetical protein
MRRRIGARQARAAEHQLDVVGEHVGRDALPQQLHGRPRAVLRVDAGAAELEQLARHRQRLGDVELGRGVEALVAVGDRAAQQPVGADDRFGALALGVVDHQQVVAVIVEPVDVAARRAGGGVRGRAELVDEHAVAQRLRGGDLVGRAREAHFEIARAQRVAEPGEDGEVEGLCGHCDRSFLSGGSDSRVPRGTPYSSRRCPTSS